MASSEYSVKSTWDVRSVLDHLASWGPLADLDLKHLTWHTFALILLFSCRHISNVLLLGVDEPFCIISEESLVFQLGYGLKQA